MLPLEDLHLATQQKLVGRSFPGVLAVAPAKGSDRVTSQRSANEIDIATAGIALEPNCAISRARCSAILICGRAPFHTS